MYKSLGLLCLFVAAMCCAGCDDGGGNILESAEQSEIEKYEAALAEEEAAMNNDFVEEK
ncbi:MAG: hypothetical protein KDB00_09670 [Planctomycetales bacterium]|nr:hypothetical protein [Planctomycetales bacterium]